MIASPEPPLDIALVVPVYNEQDCLVGVLEEWKLCLANLVRKFAIIVVDDGSTDSTSSKLAELTWAELKVHRHSNRGHGQSCLVGYQLAADAGATFVFQIDSDGQCDPVAFPSLWSHREEAPAIYGRRRNRDDGLARKLISFVLRYVLKLSWRTRLNDANVPYRLYRTALVAKVAARVPRTFDLANIAVALLMEPLGFIEEPIPFRDRLGGHASVRWFGFVKKARRLMQDLRKLRHGQPL